MIDKKVIAVDVMGGDDAPDIVIAGIEYLLKSQSKSPHSIAFLLHGDEAQISPLLAKAPLTKAESTISHTDKFVEMDAKPSAALRKGKGTSMWNAIASVKAGEADAAVSAGNTGALMAMSKLQLRMRQGVQRPAIAGIWPRPTGNCIVLDVGANIECDESQLCEFAVLGEAYYRALFGKEKPSIGLLNVGTEELKGNAVVKATHERLKAMNFGLNYYGYVEGNDISMGDVDVIVTDGFTGNIALKTAEGMAKLVGSFVSQALGGTIWSKLLAGMNYFSIKKLRDRMDPRKVNGGVFLGLNGLVIKSHGGTDSIGYANALNVAMELAQSDFQTEIENTLQALHDAELDIDISAEI